jgi:hypothetical protein
LLALVLLQKKNAVVSAAAACSACGDGFVITKPNVNVTTNNGTFTCAEVSMLVYGCMVRWLYGWMFVIRRIEEPTLCCNVTTACSK